VKGPPAATGRGHQRAPVPLTSLLGDDGSVVIPPTVAAAVLRLLVVGITERMQRDAGVMSDELRAVLAALHAASEHDASEIPIPAGSSARGTDLRGRATVTVNDAATAMECSPSYVRRLARAGRLPARRIGRDWSIDGAGLEQFRRTG
jgi:excisionase family DNA binding protein